MQGSSPPPPSSSSSPTLPALAPHELLPLPAASSTPADVSTPVQSPTFVPPPPPPPPPPASKASRAAEDAALEASEMAAKYRRYEKEFLRRINHKYFSGLTHSGESVFESSMTIDGFVFHESKDPPFKRFLEGPNLVVDHAKPGDAAPTSSGRKGQIRKG